MTYMLGILLVALEVCGMAVLVHRVPQRRFERALRASGRIPARTVATTPASGFWARYRPSPAALQERQRQPSDQLERLRKQSILGGVLMIVLIFLSPLVASLLVGIIDPAIASVAPFPGIRVAVAISGLWTLGYVARSLLATRR